jgi:predicted dehydrogenase
MKPVALGVIGCGVIGGHHLRAASRTVTVRVVAVADLLEDRVREAAAKYDIPRSHRSGAALLDDLPWRP